MARKKITAKSQPVKLQFPALSMFCEANQMVRMAHNYNKLPPENIKPSTTGKLTEFLNLPVPCAFWYSHVSLPISFFTWRLSVFIYRLHNLRKRKLAMDTGSHCLLVQTLLCYKEGGYSRNLSVQVMPYRCWRSKLLTDDFCIDRFQRPPSLILAVELK